MKACEIALEDLSLQKERAYPSAQVAEEMGFRAGYKAALKWIYSMLWLADGHVINEVKERIKQELEEE